MAKKKKAAPGETGDVLVQLQVAVDTEKQRLRQHRDDPGSLDDLDQIHERIELLDHAQLTTLKACQVAIVVPDSASARKNQAWLATLLRTAAGRCSVPEGIVEHTAGFSTLTWEEPDKD